VSFNHQPDPAYRRFRSSTAISAATSSGASSSSSTARIAGRSANSSTTSSPIWSRSPNRPDSLAGDDVGDHLPLRFGQRPPQGGPGRQRRARCDPAHRCRRAARGNRSSPTLENAPGAGGWSTAAGCKPEVAPHVPPSCLAALVYRDGHGLGRSHQSRTHSTKSPGVPGPFGRYRASLAGDGSTTSKLIDLAAHVLLIAA
jgi:hypothetical protein